MNIEKGIFQRTSLLFGDEKMEQVAQKSVIIFGIGGVGSWCAESLVRTGIRKITIVDSDRVCITNINRQLHATTKTIGKIKVEVLKARLLEINPNAEVTAIQQIYNQDNHDFFHIETYDYIIDAIDSLSSKVHLIRMATKTNSVFFSSMGASLKIDPTRIKVTEFWKVQGCPLAARLRKMIRRGALPDKPFLCVYSDEVLDNKGSGTTCGTDKCLCPKAKFLTGNPELSNHEWCSTKAVINGTTAHITAIFGFTIAGLVIRDIYNH
ncbi:MAG: tRNA threonylcarbamoyladenosine dehydratase [Bacteroidota bacterium]|nr:tRNA threonylcarbamoyladenosine dehydratase [Bacteroidota bacterium]MDP4226797.1 tRNA threonylcarbamoyladenosine dehydratase [Bacteroidota bacterium]MDP4275219.1 tRNA threonylcarbamoyladenosine dehydratase [Bacteroidota bacterium]